MKLVLLGSSRPLRAQTKNRDRRPTGGHGSALFILDGLTLFIA